MLAQLFALLPLLAVASASPIEKRDDSVLIRAGRDGKCLALAGLPNTLKYNLIDNGTPVITTDCANANTWSINRGSGSITVPNTGYALDIGLNPGNNGALKVWTSYPGAKQQTWYYTDDNRIAQTGGNQCLDEGDNGVQTYECTTGNTNQIWYTGAGSGSSTPSTTTASTPATTTAPASSGSDPLPSIPKGDVPADVAGQGKRIRLVGRDDLCVTVAGGFAGINTRVGLASCFANGDTFTFAQLFDVPAQGSTGPIRVHSSPNLCLDAGSNPSNGVGAKLYTCYDGLAQQQWTYSGTTLRTANNQCFDIVKESSQSFEKPYPTDRDAQTWECSNNGDPYQQFEVLA